MEYTPEYLFKSFENLIYQLMDHYKGDLGRAKAALSELETGSKIRQKKLA